MSDTRFSEVVESALDGLGKAEAVTSLVAPATKEVAKDMAAAFVASGKERLEDFLTGDDETDRLTMAGVALANEINSTVDWSAVPGEVLKSAYTALRVALAVAAIF